MKSMFRIRGLIFCSLLGLLLVLQSCALLPPDQPQPTDAQATETQPALLTTEPLATTTTRQPSPQPSLTNTEAAPTEVAVIAPDSQVRRLVPAVFAGNAQPLPELTDNLPVGLQPGGLVTTGADGEAEVLIQGCLKLFVFQDVTLQRSTCRRGDSASGLAVCSAGGMTGVLNQCASQIDIQTPGSTAQTSGTWFAVIYLPEDRLSIVQVYEGVVNISAAIDPRAGDWTQSAQLAAGNLWFTAPGEEPPVINGITGREAQPMEVWQALRPELIQRYPNLDDWMQAAEQRAGEENLVFPDFLAPPAGQVEAAFTGPLWDNVLIQRAMLEGVDWKDLVQQNWFDFNIAPRLLLPNYDIPDARELQVDRDAALKYLNESGYWNDYSTINIVSLEGDFNANQFAYSLQSALADIKVPAEVFTVGEESFKVFREYSDPNVTSPFILLETSGEAFSFN